MNYLILTPDGVGSTILQRIITTSLYLEKIPVTNTHELTNGLSLKSGIVTKDFDLKYSQKLNEISNIINNSSKKIQLVSRIAKYHLDARKDPIDEQQKFFNFLNNFFQKKIMCVRENIFEYAMSWSIRDKSKVLNIYTKEDREKVLQVSEVDEDYFLNKCKEYVQYQNWIEKYFPNIEKVSYEDIVINSDTVIERLTGCKETFKNNFGLPLSEILKLEYNVFNTFASQKQITKLSKEEQKALIKYKRTSNLLIEKKIIIGTPIKNTTLEDKMKQIKNFKKCLNKFYLFAKNYNWIDQSVATYDFWNQKNIC